VKHIIAAITSTYACLEENDIGGVVRGPYSDMKGNELAA